ncbi:MAG: LPS assembly lipoprotein LptE [Betaproteobacteria bacterium]|jgi:LPS-assembly lipoprotein
MQRRPALAATAAALLALAGCGFRLRGSQTYAFSQIAVLPQPGGPLAIELRRYLAASVRVLAEDEPLTQAQVVLDLLQEQREKTVVGVNASGQVREFQLRIRLRFSLRTPQGLPLIEPTDILQQRDISFNESAVLAKEAEESLLYRDMQSDIVQQLLRRLAAVKSLTPP